MERLTGHAELQALLGAYALDAVEQEEAQAIERHLVGCPRCRAEVAEHREVAGVLGCTGSSAPVGLWDRIATSLAEPPPALQLTRVVTGSSSEAASDRVDRGGPAGGSAATGPGSQAEVIAVRHSRRRLGTRAFAAMAAVAALVVAVLGVEVARLNARTDNLKNLVAEGPYQAALVNPGARRVALTSADGSRSVQAVILPDGTGWLGPHNLPALQPDETYQLWGVVGTQPGAKTVSLAVIGSHPHVLQFGAPDQVTALAVTEEISGGVVATQKQPIVAGAVPPARSPPATLGA
jgi:anti-sigma factor RsiW